MCRVPRRWPGPVATIQNVALGDTIPPGIGERALRDLRSRPAGRNLARGALAVLTLHWAVLTGILLLFVPGVEAFVQSRVGDVIVPESWAGPLLLNLIAFPLFMPVAVWAWIRTARAALGPDGQQQRRRWVPALAFVLFGFQTVCWIPFVVAFSVAFSD